jgi:hypothetical protein
MSALMVSACVVGMPWGKAAYVLSVELGSSSAVFGPEAT